MAEVIFNTGLGKITSNINVELGFARWVTVCQALSPCNLTTLHNTQRGSRSIILCLRKTEGVLAPRYQRPRSYAEWGSWQDVSVSEGRCLSSDLTAGVLSPEQTSWRRESILQSWPQTSTHASWHVHTVLHLITYRNVMWRWLFVFNMQGEGLRPGFGFSMRRPPLCCCSHYAPQKCLLQEAGSARWLLPLLRASLSMEKKPTQTLPSWQLPAQMSWERNTSSPSPASLPPPATLFYSGCQILLAKSIWDSMGRREGSVAWIFMTVTRTELLH